MTVFTIFRFNCFFNIVFIIIVKDFEVVEDVYVVVAITTIFSSVINMFSRKAGAASNGHRTSSDKTVNYLSYSRHAGFAVPLKTSFWHHKFHADKCSQLRNLAINI